MHFEALYAQQQLLHQQSLQQQSLKQNPIHQALPIPVAQPARNPYANGHVQSRWDAPVGDDVGVAGGSLAAKVDARLNIPHLSHNRATSHQAVWRPPSPGLPHSQQHAQQQHQAWASAAPDAPGMSYSSAQHQPVYHAQQTAIAPAAAMLHVPPSTSSNGLPFSGARDAIPPQHHNPPHWGAVVDTSSRNPQYVIPAPPPLPPPPPPSASIRGASVTQASYSAPLAAPPPPPASVPARRPECPRSERDCFFLTRSGGCYMTHSPQRLQEEADASGRVLMAANFTARPATVERASSLERPAAVASAVAPAPRVPPRSQSIAAAVTNSGGASRSSPSSNGPRGDNIPAAPTATLHRGSDANPRGGKAPALPTSLITVDATLVAPPKVASAVVTVPAQSKGSSAPSAVTATPAAPQNAAARRRARRQNAIARVGGSTVVRVGPTAKDGSVCGRARDDMTDEEGEEEGEVVAVPTTTRSPRLRSVAVASSPLKPAVVTAVTAGPQAVAAHDGAATASAGIKSESSNVGAASPMRSDSLSGTSGDVARAANVVSRRVASPVPYCCRAPVASVTVVDRCAADVRLRCPDVPIPSALSRVVACWVHTLPRPTRKAMHCCRGAAASTRDAHDSAAARTVPASELECASLISFPGAADNTTALGRADQLVDDGYFSRVSGGLTALDGTLAPCIMVDNERATAEPLQRDPAIDVNTNCPSPPLPAPSLIGGLPTRYSVRVVLLTARGGNVGDASVNSQVTSEGDITASLQALVRSDDNLHTGRMSLIGGPCRTDVDGGDPRVTDAPLVAAAIRLAREQATLDLSRCRRWVKVLDVMYHRAVVVGGAAEHVEVVSLLLPLDTAEQAAGVFTRSTRGGHWVDARGSATKASKSRTGATLTADDIAAMKYDELRAALRTAGSIHRNAKKEELIARLIAITQAGADTPNLAVNIPDSVVPVESGSNTNAIGVAVESSDGVARTPEPPSVSLLLAMPPRVVKASMLRLVSLQDLRESAMHGAQNANNDAEGALESALEARLLADTLVELFTRDFAGVIAESLAARCRAVKAETDVLPRATTSEVVVGERISSSAVITAAVSTVPRLRSEIAASMPSRKRSRHGDDDVESARSMAARVSCAWRFFDASAAGYLMKEDLRRIFELCGLFLSTTSVISLLEMADEASDNCCRYVDIRGPADHGGVNTAPTSNT